MNVKDLIKTAKIFVSNNSPTILTVSSVIGVISTVILASQDTIKAQDILRGKKFEDKKEVFEATWKCYIPTAISASLTVACIVGSHYCSTRQKEALTSAYLLSQTTLHEYQKRVIERIGEKKEREIKSETRKAIAAERSPIVTTGLMSGGAIEAIDTGHGTSLFYDVPGDIYFKSDINFLKSSVNDLNHELLSEMEFDWNELYYRWGLPGKKYGSEMIFDVDRPLDLKLEPELMENGQVRILVDYELYPRCIGR